MIRDYGLVDVAEHRKKAAFRRWSSAAQHLTEALEKIVMVAHDEGKLTSRAIELYCTSWLEHEVNAGIMSTSVTRMPYCMCYVRHIDGIEFHLNEQLAPKYVDVVDTNNIRTIDKAKSRRLQELKESLEDLKSELLKQRRRRMYEAYMWEASRYNSDDDDAASSTRRRLTRLDTERLAEDYEDRLFEDPLYLMQYTIAWEDTNIGALQSPENDAFMNAENQVYLSKFTKDFVNDCRDLVYAFFFDPFRSPRLADRLEEELIHQKTLLASCNARNVAFKLAAKSGSDMRSDRKSTRLNSSH